MRNKKVNIFQVCVLAALVLVTGCKGLFQNEMLKPYVLESLTEEDKQNIYEELLTDEEKAKIFAELLTDEEKARIFDEVFIEKLNDGTLLDQLRLTSEEWTGLYGLFNDKLTVQEKAAFVEEWCTPGQKAAYFDEIFAARGYNKALLTTKTVEEVFTEYLAGYDAKTLYGKLNDGQKLAAFKNYLATLDAESYVALLNEAEKAKFDAYIAAIGKEAADAALADEANREAIYNELLTETRKIAIMQEVITSNKAAFIEFVQTDDLQNLLVEALSADTKAEIFTELLKNEVITIEEKVTILADVVTVDIKAGIFEKLVGTKAVTVTLTDEEKAAIAGSLSTDVLKGIIAGRDEKAPEDVTGLTVLNTIVGKQSGVSLWWNDVNTSKAGNEDLDWYVVTWKDNGETASSARKIADNKNTLKVAEPKAYIASLTAGHTYTFTVQSMDETGNKSAGVSKTVAVKAVPKANINEALRLFNVYDAKIDGLDWERQWENGTAGGTTTISDATLKVAKWKAGNTQTIPLNNTNIKIDNVSVESYGDGVGLGKAYNIFNQIPNSGAGCIPVKSLEVSNLTADGTNVTHNIFSFFTFEDGATVTIKDSSFNLNAANNVLMIANSYAKNVTIRFENVDWKYAESGDSAYAALVLFQTTATTSAALRAQIEAVSTWNFEFVNCRYNGAEVAGNTAIANGSEGWSNLIYFYSKANTEVTYSQADAMAAWAELAKTL